MTRTRTLAGGVAILAVTANGFAQQPAVPTPVQPACTVSGKVSGAGSSLPGASIALRADGVVRALTSTSVDGTFRLAAPPGAYDLAAELTGFDRLTRPVALDPSACEQTIDLTMTIAARAARQGPAAQGADRPGGRRFQALALQAGESVAATAQQGDTEPEAAALLLPPGFGAEAGADAIALNGGATRLDRGQLNDRLDALGRGDLVPGSLDVPAWASMGGAGFGGPGLGNFAGLGGQGNAGGPGPGGLRGDGGRGRPGGPGGFFLGGRRGQPTRISATVDYTLAGSMLDAAPFQLRSDAPAIDKPYTRHAFGTTLGGPLKIPHLYDGTNRTSFMVGYNGSRGSSLFDQYATVPTASMRAGDFSALSFPLIDPSSGLPFAGNQIPADRLSPQAASLMRFIPAPNLDGSTRNYHYSTTLGSASDALNLRLIHNFTPNADGPAAGGFGGRGGGAAEAPGAGRGQPRQVRGTSVSLTAQLQYRRADGDQANVFSELGGTTESASLSVPISLNISRGRNQHLFTVNVSRSSNSTLNHFANVENVAGDAGLLGAGTDPFGWGVPALSFTSITSVRDLMPSERDDRRITAGYTWTHPIARHLLRTGGDIRLDRSSSRTEGNAAGTFLFTGLYSTAGAGGTPGADVADFLLGLPQQASLQDGPGSVAFTGRATSLFVQDEWRARPDLTLNLGLRYELLWPFNETDDRMANLDVTPDFTAAAPVLAGAAGAFTGAFPAALLRTDRNNLAPRIGVAWRRPNHVVVRAGYGVSYNSGSYAAIARNLASQPPFAVTETNIGTLNQALLLEDALAGRSSETTNNYGVDKDYAIGRVQTWNADVSRTFREVWLVGTGYTRTTGSSLDIVRAPNRGPDGLRIDGVQPFLWQSAEGSSVLNSVAFRVQRRAVRGIGGGLMYTIARSRDDAPSIGGTPGSAAVVAQNDQDLNAEWGLSNFDRRQRLQANLQVDLPFGPNRRWLSNGGSWATLLENWRVTTSFLAESGTPLTARVQGATRDVSQGVNGALRADYTGSPIALDTPTIDRFFNTDAFSAPAAGLFGTSPRNLIIGPGSRQLDVNLSRDVRLGVNRAVTIQIRAANLLDLVNYAAIDTDVNSPTFGEVLAVKPMRSVQANLRFRF